MTKTHLVIIGLVLMVSCIWIPYLTHPYVGVASLIAGFALLIYAFMKG